MIRWNHLTLPDRFPRSYFKKNKLFSGFNVLWILYCIQVSLQLDWDNRVVETKGSQLSFLQITDCSDLSGHLLWQPMFIHIDCTCFSLVDQTIVKEAAFCLHSYSHSRRRKVTKKSDQNSIVEKDIDHHFIAIQTLSAVDCLSIRANCSGFNVGDASGQNKLSDWCVVIDVNTIPSRIAPSAARHSY
jgi:hypothetical protein